MSDGGNIYVSEDFADLIVFYLENTKRLDNFKQYNIHFMNEAFAIVHLPVALINTKTISTFGYSAMPKLYGLTSEVSLEASNVNKLRNTPNLNLRGSGVLIGFIDTGIDYTNPLFRKADGSTKIISIWDQTIETGKFPYETGFGTEYKQDLINQALSSENPLDVVPSRDEIGHGTMMAAAAAGNENPAVGFSGVAPDSELVIVKLKQAKQYLKKFYMVPDNVICYPENYIMWGVQYCIRLARDLNRPLVLCLGIGSSQGSHDGRTLLSIFLSIFGDLPGITAVVSAGNEGNLGRHYFGNIDPSIGYNTVELNIGENDNGFSMELWGNSPGLYSIDILTPSGEFVPRMSASIALNREISFIFDKTIIYIDYLITESETGDQLILMRFQNVAAGVWKFNVYGQGNLQGGFHCWLPMGTMISDQTYFIQPDIYTTILSPGNSIVPIVMTAYNPVNKSLYTNASRGYTRANVIKPELAAPGVNYIAPNQNKEFINYTGTGIAAAHTAGIVALIYEWGEVKGNNPGMDSLAIKNYLVRGAEKNPVLTYPNRNWGYGMINIFNVFSALRTDYGK